jgi:hypothetical protein
MRAALDAWAVELRRIVSPPADDGKVVRLREQGV